MAPSSNWSRRPASQAGNVGSSPAGVTMRQCCFINAREDGFCRFQLPPAGSIIVSDYNQDMWLSHLDALYK